MRKLGDRALLIERPANVPARVLLERVRAWPNAVDAVIAETHVAAYFSADPSIDEAAVAALSAPSVLPSTVAREHVLRVSYDGEDLHEVAARTRMSPAEVVRLHSEGTYEVAMMGFTPGFAYLSGIDGRLVVARRAVPRTSVPAGSVAVAGPYTGVYPRESPGGWNIIGTVVDCAMFDAELGPRLALGDRVRFEPVT